MEPKIKTADELIRQVAGEFEPKPFVKEVLGKVKISGTDNRGSIPKNPLLERNLTYQEVEECVEKLLPNSSISLKLALAVAASANYTNPAMLWLLLVGVPSSGKTDLVRLLKDAPTTYSLDNLTLNALISGERQTEKEKVHDLLPLLDKKCLIVKDWTSIFSLDEKMTKKILGDLVGCYDREFSKFSSRRGNISYKSEFSQLGCVTPATLNRHSTYMNMVGPRFLCYSMPVKTEAQQDTSFDNIFSGKDRPAIEKEARSYVSTYLNQIIQKEPDIEKLNPKSTQYLKLASLLMACARGIVLLQAATFIDDSGKSSAYYDVLDVQVEEPWRAVQQLIALSKYLAYVQGKNSVGEEELAIIKEVVISSMPQDRSMALRMIKENNGQVTAKQLSDVSEKSIKTSRRLLDELTALGVLTKIKGIGAIANDYKLNDRFAEFILVDSAEFMSSYSSGTESRHGVLETLSLPTEKPVNAEDYSTYEEQGEEEA